MRGNSAFVLAALLLAGCAAPLASPGGSPFAGVAPPDRMTLDATFDLATASYRVLATFAREADGRIEPVPGTLHERWADATGATLLERETPYSAGSWGVVDTPQGGEALGFAWRHSLGEFALSGAPTRSAVTLSARYETESAEWPASATVRLSDALRDVAPASAMLSMRATERGLALTLALLTASGEPARATGELAARWTDARGDLLLTDRVAFEANGSGDDATWDVAYERFRRSLADPATSIRVVGIVTLADGSALEAAPGVAPLPDALRGRVSERIRISLVNATEACVHAVYPDCVSWRWRATVLIENVADAPFEPSLSRFELRTRDNATHHNVTAPLGFPSVLAPQSNASVYLEIDGASRAHAATLSYRAARDDVASVPWAAS